jgi:RNA polymerase sigma factor (sigma-70 family)
VTEHGPAILRICRALLPPHDAEDAWSETFLSALRAYPDLAADANVEAWLVTIAKRKAVDLHRAAVRAPTPVSDVPDVPDFSTAGDPATHEHDDLWDALRSLPAMQRESIAYHYLGGLPYALVAGIVGNSEAAARRAAADGMKTLRRTYRKGES